MNSGHPDGFTMIGLHKLAAHGDDGLVPALYEVFLENAARQRSYPNVVLFPAWEARMPGEAAAKPLGADAADGNNIVAFPRYAERANKKKA
ncbi:hypothetical protein [Rhizobium mesosinicum]|uniref:Uncharacterized protein n=1 Tax=Rhizobium mesosinicum TaxID=335017 RepID=A0ABS7H5C9_9HYPH|nr:hypothetical protein [Rhizobium mesosinicum]MBW9056544.1 hypothetical protein [Rhizobium mesosinicum]